MRKILTFWWLCCKSAASGNYSFANDWQWAFGFPVLAFILFKLAPSTNIPTDTWWGAALTAGLAFFLTWSVRFLLRLLSEPAKVYYAEKERAEALQSKWLKQRDLDDLTELRTRLAQLRIEMENAPVVRSKNEWGKLYHALEEEIAEKIEKFSTKSEAGLYRTRGNIPRPIRLSAPAHQIYIDTAIHDLDYLKEFILRYSGKG